MKIMKNFLDKEKDSLDIWALEKDESSRGDFSQKVKFHLPKLLALAKSTENLRQVYVSPNVRANPSFKITRKWTKLTLKPTA